MLFSKNFYFPFSWRNFIFMDVLKLYPDLYQRFSQLVQKQDRKGPFIFFGPRGVGKADFALIFAKSFLCGNMPPCGFCSECVYENHPDILIVKKAEQDERLKAEYVRSAVEFATIPPYSFHKFIIIQDAELMTQQGHSALLKTLEEVKNYTTFILITSKLELIPSTILSRCIRVRFLPKIEDLVSVKLQERGFSDEIKDVLKNISYFNFSVIEKSEDRIERIWRIISCIISPLDSVAEYVKLINEVKDFDEAREVLDALESFLSKNYVKLGKFSVELWEKVKSAREKLEIFINPKLVLLSLIF